MVGCLSKSHVPKGRGTNGVGGRHRLLAAVVGAHYGDILPKRRRDLSAGEGEGRAGRSGGSERL